MYLVCRLLLERYAAHPHLHSFPTRRSSDLKDGDTALHGAARRERADSIVQFLVDHGANMNAKNKMGWTPLFIAEGIDTTGFHVKSDTTAAQIGRAHV